jgi:Tfp pilus assembly PilM family ATPase
MSLLSSMFGGSRGPVVALEIASDRVSALRLSSHAAPGIAAHAVESVPRGAVTPSLLARNIQDSPAVGEALTRVLGAMGRPGRVGLLVPDAIAKVSFVRLERVPERRDELDQLVRWHVRKAVPFPTEEAQVAWTPGAAHAEGREFIVTIARRAVVEEYEGLCVAAGAHPGTVDLSTFNLVNAILAGRTPPASDWLLVNLTRDYVSLALLRDDNLLFFRGRGLDTTDAVPDLIHQTAMYCEDRLQGRGLGRVVLATPSDVHTPDRDDLRRRIEEAWPGVVEFIDARMADIPLPAGRSPVAADIVLPLVGLLRRGRSAA